MRSGKAGARRAAGTALVLVFALTVVAAAAAGKKPPPPTGDKTPPTTPTNLQATNLTHKTVTLAWNPSTDNSGSVTYVVDKDGQGFTVPQGQTTYTIDWLSPGQTYNFNVRAYDGSLNGSAASNTVTVTTPADTTPPTTPALSGFVRGPSQVELSWTRSTDDLSPFVGYRIFANGVQVTAHINWYAETRVVLRHLMPATSYTFTVQAHDHNGNNSATSNAVPLTTEATNDVTPPSAPTNVRIVGSFGCPEFFVGWTQSSDDTDPQFAIEYEIYVNGVLSPLPVSAGVDQDFVYATASGANTFTVKAVDRAGNTSAASNGATEFC
jgi:chitodextrinase